MTVDLQATRAARATLALLTPTRHRALHELLVSFGPAEALAWLTAPGTPDQDREEILHGVTVEQLLTQATIVEGATNSAGARVLIPEDDQWPTRLDDSTRVAFAAAPSSALCLWVRGTADLSAALTRTVAITGARTATAYGTTVATELGHDLTAAGWSVATTSGYGIDSAALRGALAAGGPAFAVLPAGIDQLYPAGNSELLHLVADRGLLISANPPGTTATSYRFAAARRLLAGLTSGAVVVEAARYSGALAVLQETLDRGRRAMAIPDPVTSALSTGVHEFLRDHSQARLVRDTRDILAELPPVS
jgi:DNA processing protein